MNKTVFLAFVAFVTGCASQPQNVGSPTVPVQIDLTRPPIIPSASFSPPVVAEDPVETPDPVSLTQNAEVLSCAGNEKNWYDKLIWKTYFTNGQWNAFVCKDNGIYTKVSNPILGVVWNIPALEDDQTNPGPEWYWLPYMWSDDGKYLYLRSYCLCFIDSPWLIYSSGFGLARLNLETGQVDTWLEPNHSGYSFDFSEGGELLAFSPPNLPNIITIRDLASGIDRNLLFKEQYLLLEYRWTPDKSRLVIFTQEYGNNQFENGFSVFVYSVDSGVLGKLIERDNLNSSFPTEKFIEPRIYISDLKDDILFLSDIFNENNFQLNVRSGELVYVTELMTPTVIP